MAFLQLYIIILINIQGDRRNNSPSVHLRKIMLNTKFLGFCPSHLMILIEPPIFYSGNTNSKKSICKYNLGFDHNLEVHCKFKVISKSRKAENFASENTLDHV